MTDKRQKHFDSQPIWFIVEFYKLIFADYKNV